MRIELLICPLVITAAFGAAAEPLEQRFGTDRERGYRLERGFIEIRHGFENRDRANFLGDSLPANGDELAPSRDLYPSLPIGLRR